MEKLGPGDPQHIGKYRLLARLGAGGMGHVYLARSERGRTVAVKLVRAELAAREEFRERFRQEVRNAQRVGGFWTAPVLDADTEAAVPWVATGYVAGPSLQRVVEHDHGPLPERSVRILAAGLAHALTNIHAAGIVHRDLKPSNVMLTIEGPRVIDFGIARALETLPGEGITQTGSLIGSPGFMAPEQVRGDRITPASDVFCLGSVLAYAATGRLPFGSTEGGEHAVLFRIAQEEPDLSSIPEGIADVVHDCLRKDPEARPSLSAILARTGAGTTVWEGRAREPWLPGELLAQLGRHAVELLEVEDPTVYGVLTEGSGAAGSGARGGADPGTRGGAESAATTAGVRPTTVHPQPTFDSPSPEHAPAHPAYGYPNQPQQHPQPQPYNPYTAAAPDPTPVHAPPPPPYDPTPADDSSRTGRSTALLVTIALVVLLAAGGSVYALMNNGGGSDDNANGNVSRSPSASAPATSGEPSPTQSDSSSATPAGTVPAGFLGTWSTAIDNSTGHNTRELTIRQGAVGDSVLTLVADGPGYHCEFTAKLTGKPGSAGPLAIGPSKVTTGKPRSACTAGEATEVTLLSGGKLKRATKDGNESLTYSKQSPSRP
ncbi:serine/threonine protein kinase [Streptomyces sp. Ag109_O5-1]|uniref:serine/threonine-protein kinase n=1 Tax=Streptomyces sp. Ag109_O5-1 TaxID=1938851 RepID=UPI000F4F5D5C|nr:serine/threonine-protein kinase [Streptomyces sp. Ag109_O5-1]RPE42018.1 serine/threonine protein kinase [Streptomyces sp. Ag109_O5-1]